MSGFDPYATLGLERSASAATIKLAYRQKVRIAHPDRGGDQDVFILVVRAFGILSDPASRRLYDETGRIDDGAVRDQRQAVVVILADMFDAALSSALSTGLALDRIDIIAEMTRAVDKSLAEARQAHKKAETDIAGLDALRGRIRRDKGGANIFAERLDAQLATRTDRRDQLARQVSTLEAARAELSAYDSTIELIAAIEQVG